MFKLLVITGLSFFNPRADSIGIETINGKTFIVHQVSEKETLYAISRRYGVTVNQILEFNKTADAGLEIGQILKVPYVPKPKVAKGTTLHKVAERETLFSISKIYGVTVDELKQWNNLSDNTLALGQELVIKSTNTTNNVLSSPPDLQPKSLRLVHTVAEKETLFSISRQYGVTVQQLKEWNNLTTEALHIGQTLFLTHPVYSGEEKVTKIQTEVTPPTQVPEVKQPEVRVTSVEEKSPVITISESVTNKDEVKQSGIAELIDGTEANRKYLALHRTAPVGTILKVRNEMNNREVFVRVVGKLPDTALTDKLIIKISKSAYDRLGAIDPRFRVEVTYYK
ncbi:MAG: LysM peptidoglycan-binding domain-containing protein [Cyclobacteriaceae bacterium]|nr:LysM peptidoglycan-binding domain-containing protein [Cyclobacteriaceae bacterium]UYN87824.1 MAG: LysM peptidoglycan-binding domain-containing protein [Cyclobacteriaceae bacterium]